MNKVVCFLYRVNYLVVIVFSWWAAFKFYQTKGLYPGKMPSGPGAERLVWYAQHPLMGLLNWMSVLTMVAGIHVLAYVGTKQTNLEKPYWVNILLLSTLFNVVWALIYALGWAGVIQ